MSYGGEPTLTEKLPCIVGSA
ncbi:protein of unknown function [Agreia sp. COWG]|nr:protein of unknown function [Agreia sp. COWG]